MQASFKLDHLHYLDEFLLFQSNDYQTIKDRISHSYVRIVLMSKYENL